MLNNWIARLKEPVPSSDINWRVGSISKDKKRGMVLAYVDARFIYDRLDWAVGPENWQIGEVIPTDKGFITSILIWDGTQWLSKTDVADYTDYEQFKGGYSDAIKRAAVLWGIGRELYSYPKIWVDLDKGGQIPAETKAKLTSNIPVARWLSLTRRKKLDTYMQEGGLSDLETTLKSLGLPKDVNISEKIGQILIRYAEEISADKISADKSAKIALQQMVLELLDR